MEPVETIELDYGFKIEIVHDNETENPQYNCDMLTIFAIYGTSRYGFGTKDGWELLLDAIRDSKYFKDSWDDQNSRFYIDINSGDVFKALEKCKDIVAMPLYVYDHSGVTISTNPFSCRWDSGCIGVVFCKRSDAKKFLGKNHPRTKTIKETILYDVQLMDDYLTGNVYGFRIIDPDGVEVDSCLGFYGDPKGYIIEEAKRVAAFETQLWKNYIPGELP